MEYLLSAQEGVELTRELKARDQAVELTNIWHKLAIPGGAVYGRTTLIEDSGAGGPGDGGNWPWGRGA